MTGGEVGLLMIGLFIITILLGFPIAFTLMGMGVLFGYYAYATPDQWQHVFQNRIFDLLVQNTFSVVSNDTLTAVPLFLFMGYVVERANILDRLFFSVQVAARRVPGSLAVATLITCALFATATGIVGAVVTLMGLLAFPVMLKAGYDTKLAAGVVCAGGCLGILIPPSIMLILYAATAGESVVKLYAGAFVPGFILAGLYIVYVVGRAMIDPKLAPALPEDRGSMPRLQVFGALLTSFFPLAILILSVLGAIIFGLATPTEAAAVGAFGSLVLAAGYRELDFPRLKEAVYLTARTTAMVTYLFVGSWTFASVFAYFGGQELVENSHQGNEHEPGGVSAALPVHHLPSRLAARMDGDHHHFRADFPPVAQVFRRQPDCVRDSGRTKHPDFLQYAADGHGSLLSQGCCTAAGPPHADLRRRPSLRFHGVHHDGAALRLSAIGAMAAGPSLLRTVRAIDCPAPQGAQVRFRAASSRCRRWPEP